MLFMTWRDAAVVGVPARIFRVGFSGELAFEIKVRADSGTQVLETLCDLVARRGCADYALAWIADAGRGCGWEAE